LLFCERQCALIHIERAWRENDLTVQGSLMHKTAHEGKPETRDGVRILRAVPLVSHVLGLRGVSDVIEKYADGRYVPVEYKRGRPKTHDGDRVQVCAQAMCLEEMLGIRISYAALYYGMTRRRIDVDLSPELRQLTHHTAERLHRLIDEGHTPPAVLEPKCSKCSLREDCMPEALGNSVRSSYLAAMARKLEKDDT